MKFLEEPLLERLSNALSVDTGDAKLFGRVEAYSCKNARADRKLYKQLELRFPDEAVEEMGYSASPEQVTVTALQYTTAHDTMSASRKTLFYLIATLNASFPDYDFSNARPEQFIKLMQPCKVASSISSILQSAGAVRLAKNSEVWEAIDRVIGLDECDVYTYAPDPDSDPYAEEGSIWSFNYFFYNKKQKRILFFTMNAVRPDALSQDASEYDDGPYVFHTLEIDQRSASPVNV